MMFGQKAAPPTVIHATPGGSSNNNRGVPAPPHFSRQRSGDTTSLDDEDGSGVSAHSHLSEGSMSMGLSMVGSHSFGHVLNMFKENAPQNGSKRQPQQAAAVDHTRRLM